MPTVILVLDFKPFFISRQITRAEKNKINTRQTSTMTRHDIYVSDECFLTGTAAEVIPVVKVDDRIIGNGKPGIATTKLIKNFRELTKKDGVRY